MPPSATGGGDVVYYGSGTANVTTGDGDDYINELGPSSIVSTGGDNVVMLGGEDGSASGSVETGNGDDLIQVCSNGDKAEFSIAGTVEEVDEGSGSPSTLTVTPADGPYDDTGLDIDFDFGGSNFTAGVGHDTDFDTTLGNLVDEINGLGGDFTAEVDGDGDLVITSDENTTDEFTLNSFETGDDVNMVDSSATTQGADDVTTTVPAPEEFDFFDGSLQVTFECRRRDVHDLRLQRA